MIYLVDSELYESFLREAVKYEEKWNKKHPEMKPQKIKTQASYIDMINHGWSTFHDNIPA